MRPEIWTVLGLAVGTTIAATMEEEALGELLIYTDEWGRRTNMSNLSDGGRRLPWPTVLDEANLTMTRLLNREIGKDLDAPDPQMTIHKYEGEPARIPSGVGMWAKPKEVTWSRNGRIMWQHTLDRPDWTDYRVRTKFSINRNYDIEIEGVTARDNGRYSAKFQIQAGSPFYLMEVDLQVHILPKPKIYSSRTSPSSRRLVLGPEDTTVEIHCQASGARPGTILGWSKEGKQQAGTRVEAESPGAKLISTLEASNKDDGALLSCYTTHNDTDRMKTSSIKVKSTANNQSTGADPPLPKIRPGQGDPRGPEGSVDSLAAFIMAAAAMAAALVGAVVLVLNKYKAGGYHLAHEPPN